MRPLQELTRKNIWRLQPYSSARNEYSGKVAKVFLDANESPYNKPFNRYPDPLQTEVKKAVARIKGVEAGQIFVGNGSDEAIDLSYRCFTCPGTDNVVAIEPTYGMYRVCADINDVEYRPVLLDEHFDIDAGRILAACDSNTKIVWLCTPNNPTGNALCREEMLKVTDRFDGLVVVDEAYSDFSTVKSLRHELSFHPNLIILNTMSKAWGCASIRMGMAFASKEIIDIFNRVKYPYNVSGLTQQQALRALSDPYEVDKWVRMLIQERDRMMEAFRLLPICQKVFPSEANFFLVRVTNAQAVYDYLVNRGIIVRNRTKVALCHDCLRITIGTKSENNELLAALRGL